MSIEEQIESYFVGLPEHKGSELRILHEMALKAGSDCRLWFLDGTDATGKVVSNPNIGYGKCLMPGGREFYRVGLSANTGGISVYVMGLTDKEVLKREFGERIGRATVTGYCLKFRKLADVDLGVLKDLFAFAFGLD